MDQWNVYDGILEEEAWRLTGKRPLRCRVGGLQRAAPRTRTRSTARHLVTPTQADAFYERAFRELEVLERDLLERGPFPRAAEPVLALDREAGELADALGPPARSGDREFQAVLRRIEAVRSYISRVRGLLDVPHGAELARPPEAAEESSVLGRLGRLLRRDDG